MTILAYPSPLEVLSVRGTKDLAPDRWSYKLAGSGQFGLDVAIGDSLDIDPHRMAVRFPYADGNRRDGVGDLLEIGGINCERHRKNPVVLYDHGKQVSLPIGLAEDPETHEYTIQLDPMSKQAWVKAFFYQGKGLAGVEKEKEYNHALLCEQLFDLMSKRYVRGGSIGYQVIKALPLQPNYEMGTPSGMHLLQVLQLEASAVVMPANMDTVLKMLSLPSVCGKPLSTPLVKSLQAYAPEKKCQLGWEPRKGKSLDDVPNYQEASDPARSCASCKFFVEGSGPLGRCDRYIAPVGAEMTCDSWAGAAVGVKALQDFDYKKTADVEQVKAIRRRVKGVSHVVRAIGTHLRAGNFAHAGRVVRRAVASGAARAGEHVARVAYHTAAHTGNAKLGQDAADLAHHASKLRASIRSATGLPRKGEKSRVAAAVGGLVGGDMAAVGASSGRRIRTGVVSTVGRAVGYAAGRVIGGSHHAGKVGAAIGGAVGAYHAHGEDDPPAPKSLGAKRMKSIRSRYHAKALDWMWWLRMIGNVVTDPRTWQLLERAPQIMRRLRELYNEGMTPEQAWELLKGSWEVVKLLTEGKSLPRSGRKCQATGKPGPCAKLSIPRSHQSQGATAHVVDSKIGGHVPKVGAFRHTSVALCPPGQQPIVNGQGNTRCTYVGTQPGSQGFRAESPTQRRDISATPSKLPAKEVARRITEDRQGYNLLTYNCQHSAADATGTDPGMVSRVTRKVGQVAQRVWQHPTGRLAITAAPFIAAGVANIANRKRTVREGMAEVKKSLGTKGGGQYTHQEMFGHHGREFGQRVAGALASNAGRTAAAVGVGAAVTAAGAYGAYRGVQAIRQRLRGTPSPTQKSLDALRNKYRKGHLKRLRRGSPGSAMIHVHRKDLDKLDHDAQQRGVEWRAVGGLGRHYKVKLTGDDQHINALAQRYGRTVKKG